MTTETYHDNRLYAALCRYYKPLSWEEYKDMDIQEVTDAITFSGMPKEAVDLIWEKKHAAFDIFRS